MGIASRIANWIRSLQSESPIGGMDRLSIERGTHARSESMLISAQTCLGVIAIAGLAIPLSFPKSFSQEAKLTMMVMGSMGCLGGLVVASSDASTKLQKLGQTLDNVDGALIRARLEAKASQQALEEKIRRDEELAALALMAGGGNPNAVQAMAKQVGVMPYLPVAAPPVLESPRASFPVAIPLDSAPTQSTYNADVQELPDGAELITVEDLAIIKRYPVVMAIAEMGQGKTATIGWILRRMEGLRVFASPDAKKSDYPYYHKVFGAYGNMGKSNNPDDVVRTMDRDLSAAGDRGSILRFLWGTYAEIKNRQQLEKRTIEQLPIYRIFFDEMASVYSTLQKTDKDGATLMELSNQENFFNCRKHRMQLFYGAQSESVELIGLKNLAKARDAMWHLYPGPSAIAQARSHKRLGLAGYLMDQLQQGNAIALLIKNDMDFHVLKLPSVAELEREAMGDEVSVSDSGSSPNEPGNSPGAWGQAPAIDNTAHWLKQTPEWTLEELHQRWPGADWSEEGIAGTVKYFARSFQMSEPETCDRIIARYIYQWLHLGGWAQKSDAEQIQAIRDRYRLIMDSDLSDDELKQLIGMM